MDRKLKIMKFELKRDYNRNGKLLKAGQILEVTQEMYDWLKDNDYGKSEKKTKKASDKKQETEL